MVSVIIPVFNREKTVLKAIQSVLDQTYKDIELIIVDDNSTDNTLEVVKRYLEGEENVKILKNQNSKGVSGARNFGMQNATGEYIAFLDSDDEYLPNHIEDSVQVLEQYHQNVSFSFWYENSMNEKNEIVRSDRESSRPNLLRVANEIHAEQINNVILYGKEFFEYTCTSSCYCYHIITMVMRRSLLEKGILFDETLRCSEDDDFILRIIHETGFALIMDYHACYNQGSDNLYNFMDRKSINLKEAIRSTEVVQKLTSCWLNKIHMYERRLSFVQEHKGEFKMYDKLVYATKFLLAQKYCTLAILNQSYDRYQACIYMMHSLKIAGHEDEEWKKEFIYKALEENEELYICSLDKLNLY